MAFPQGDCASASCGELPCDLAGDTALERVTYTASVWPGDDARPIDLVSIELLSYLEAVRLMR
jgi:hypothetical protein